MGHRDTKNGVIERADLVIVIYPYMDWDWQRYRIGDLGIVIEIRDYSTHAVARVRLFRTGVTESIPIEYISKLGDKNGSGRFNNIT